MKHTKFYLPSLLLAGLLQTTIAFAGATNSGDNTAAVPGENSSNTVTPVDGTYNKNTDNSQNTDMNKSNNSTSNKSPSDKKAKKNNSTKSMEDCYAADGKLKSGSLDCNTDLNTTK
ncbi:MAG: hypothetical protein PSV17_02240 [Methylotenera sp.]|uniref:hypothetical protein n=1 Tax=Methylotenera sp. TaxID=2051956 RepID=UPI002487D310|nr:hypothetical protein [Methylotenera sp.]MDI1308238.1 hypothetical protein [Methylotenera sp.]